MSGIIFNAGVFGSGPYVLSFNTRTGAVTLLGSDVIAALGYTPANAADVVSSFNTRVGDVVLLGSDVLNAVSKTGTGSTFVLQEAPDITGATITESFFDFLNLLSVGSYLPVDPGAALKVYSYLGNYVITGAGNKTVGLDVSLIGATPRVQRFPDKDGTFAMLSDIGVTSFNTRTGAVVLLSADVIAALGYTPVNKAGDVMTGDLEVPNLLVSGHIFDGGIQDLSVNPTVDLTGNLVWVDYDDGYQFKAMPSFNSVVPQTVERYTGNNLTANGTLFTHTVNGVGFYSVMLNCINNIAPATSVTISIAYTDRSNVAKTINSTSGTSTTLNVNNANISYNIFPKDGTDIVVSISQSPFTGFDIDLNIRITQMN